MNCPCDELVFPRPPAIAAGLDRLPRQWATFPEWRAALLRALGGRPALAGWRARERDDFGLMLLEMWAYVCDAISFYDEVIAHECYPRTARRRPSLRKLVGLLGYLPRPAVAAAARLAVLADGRRTLLLPPGTAFRSGAFPGSPPQVFELTDATTVHPLLNQWRLRRQRPVTLGAPSSVVTLPHLLLEPGSVRAKAGDPLLVIEAADHHVRRVASLAPHRGQDGLTYTRLVLDAPVSPIGDTAYADFRALVPTASGALWKLGDLGGDPSPLDDDEIVLDGLYRQIPAGAHVLLGQGEDVRWFQVTQVAEVMRTVLDSLTSQLKDTGGTVTATVVSPKITVPVTRLTLDEPVNASSRKTAGVPDWGAADIPGLTLHHALVDAGRITAELPTTLGKTDPLAVEPPHPDPGVPPAGFLLEDADQDGVVATGQLNFVTGALALDTTVEWPEPLTAPVQLYGNVLAVTRGESVVQEQLGVGDASLATQAFTLKKKPLTYLPSPTAGNDQAVASTLAVFVGGVRWREVASFFAVKPDAEVYVVRQDDAGASTVTFGGGARLPTGAVVTASYRFGAGAATPPAGSIQQLARPVPGLKGVRNPVAAFGGADAESAERLATYAPRSALLLGRAVSIQDLEAAAATVPGVRAVSAEWRWNAARQRPLVQIHYVGASPLAPTVSQKLHGLTDPTTPIAVDPATPLPRTLALQIEIDPRHLEADVLRAVRAALMRPETGFLAPERIGIGVPLFRSRLFAVVLAVPGVVAVRGLLVDGLGVPDYGITPGAGHYFDFEAGTLLLNGRATDG
jgi:hypothetical protein